MAFLSQRVFAAGMVGLWAATAAPGQTLKTANVILITTDGLRWQEVFSGADPELMNKEHGGLADEQATRAAFWRDAPQARREALMPFLWSTVARQGQIFGNQARGSIARLTNTRKFSYPGYNEILTGFADDRIDSNAKRPNENVTVLEWLNRRPAFQGRVAAFSGWDVMPFIINRDRAGFPVMGGWERVPEKEPNARQALLNELIAETTRGVESELYDSFVFHAALEHLQRHMPRVLYVGFLETDHWGHAGRYDQVLRMAHHVDGWIRRLWETVQSMTQYKDRTTFLVTVDHGRGSAPEKWKHHGNDIDGAENIWLAVLGPDTPPLGERSHCSPVTQSQVAATLAALLGEDYHAAVPQSGAPIRDVLPAAK